MKLPGDIESRDLDLLEPQFADKLRELQINADRLGFKMHIATTVRGPITQAKLFCRSRTVEEIAVYRDILLGAEAPVLASLYKDEYTAISPPVTQFGPGMSWHQWGLAADIFQVVDGKAKWTGPEQKELARKAKRIPGLFGCSMTTRTVEMPHFHYQDNFYGTPFLKPNFIRHWRDIERKMRQKYEL